VDAGSVLGVSALRPAFLDDVSAAEPRQSETRRRARIVTIRDIHDCGSRAVRLQDDFEDFDEDDDDFDNDDEDADEDAEDDEEDEETWQVRDRVRTP